MKTKPPAGVVVLATLAVLGSPLRAEPAASDLQATFVDVTSPEAKPYRDTGDRAIDRLAITMITDVANGVARNGAAVTVDQCHLKDIPMKDGLVGGMPRITAMKLTSLKLRNPANAPDAAERAALETMKAQLDTGLAPGLLVQKVTRPGGATEWRVYKPLANIRQCGVCHAKPEEMPADLRQKLEQKYASDQATGYTFGDWRGVMRVTVADPPPPPKPVPPTPPTDARKGRRSG